MKRRHSCSGGEMTRRGFLGAIGVGASASLLPWTWSWTAASAARATQQAASFGFPGPFPGRVVEIQHPAMIRGGVKSAEAITAAMRRGMVELTGADDATSA